MAARIFVFGLLIVLLSAAAYADIPPPKATPTTDWSFVLMGAITAFLGAVLCVWLGRKLFRRPQ